MKPFLTCLALMVVLLGASLTTRAQSTTWMQLKRSGIPKVSMGINDSNAFYINKEDNGAILLKGANVVVGTEYKNISDTAFKLYVDKGICTRLIKVDVDAWADFVFEPSYRIPTLQEVEQFIRQHKHLPGVISANEVQSNGVDLGANQAVLLQKIEELTLYVIGQNKKIDALQQEVKALKDHAAVQ